MTHDDEMRGGESLGVELSWDSGLSYAFGPEDPDEVRAEALVAGKSSGAGRYVIEEELARGGVGTVHRARDRDLGREVALKRLRPELADDPLAVQRFFREARIAGQIQHPGVPPVHDFGLDAEDRPFLAMKLLKGRTLAELLTEAEEGARSRAMLLDAFESVLETMAHTHALGIVHRDLKPENVMIGGFGEVAIMDWGFGKRIDLGEDAELVDPEAPDGVPPEDPGLSMVGTVMGTAHSMAPEQARGEIDRVDRRADVFALGGLLLRVLTGRGPYEDGSGGEQALSRARRGAVGDLRADLDAMGAPDELRDLVVDALAAEPEDRPGDAGEMLARFSAYKLDARAREERARHEAAEARASARVARRTRQLVLALSLVVIAALVAGGLVWQGDASERAALQGEVRGALRDLEATHAAGGGREAIAAAEQLMARVRARLGDDPLLDELQERQASWQRSVAAESFLVELDGIHEALVRGDSGSEGRWQEAFRARGVNVATWQPGQTGYFGDAWNDATRREAALVLDLWATSTRELDAQNMRALARALDDDDQRRLARRAMTASDIEPLLGELAEPTPVTTALVVVRALRRLSLDQRAITLLRRVTREHPDAFWLHLELGLVLETRPSDAEEAERQFAAARVLRPASPAAALGQMRILTARGRTQDAIDHVERSLRFGPPHPEVVALLASLYEDVGREADAVALRERSPGGRPGRGGPRSPRSRGGPEGRPGPGGRRGPPAGEFRLTEPERIAALAAHHGPDASPADQAAYARGLVPLGEPERALAILEAAGLSVDSSSGSSSLDRTVAETTFYANLALGRYAEARRTLDVATLDDARRLRLRLERLDGGLMGLASFFADGTLPDDPGGLEAILSVALHAGSYDAAVAAYRAVREQGSLWRLEDRFARQAAAALLELVRSAPDDAMTPVPTGEAALAEALGWARAILIGGGTRRDRPGPGPGGRRARGESILAWELDGRLEALRATEGWKALVRQVAR